MTALTNKQKQDIRKAALQKAAERDGFANWSQAMTAWMKGQAVMVKVQKVEKETK